jgi:hypothetical protein
MGTDLCSIACRRQMRAMEDLWDVFGEHFSYESGNGARMARFLGLFIVRTAEAANETWQLSMDFGEQMHRFDSSAKGTGAWRILINSRDPYSPLHGRTYTYNLRSILYMPTRSPRTLPASSRNFLKAASARCSPDRP